MSAKRTVLVVGLCGHGLSIVRALRCSRLRVFAIEANMDLPGVRTNAAELIPVEDLSNGSLVTTLIECAPRLASEGLPILILTNDNMVKTVGEHIDELAEFYHVSWAACVDSLLPLLYKENIERRCRQTGLRYPRSETVRRATRILSVGERLNFPLIAKPDAPLSAFKTLMLRSIDDLTEHREIIGACLPVLFQEFIPGGDDCIRFCALYLDNGEVRVHFEGRKLRSRPMGHTTIAVGEGHVATFELAQRFFAGLALSGPVSLEVKTAPDGRQYVIEPTVGRTDFWVGLCIAENVNLPQIECLDTVLAAQTHHPQRSTIWINEERDPIALLWLLVRHPRTLAANAKVALYFDRNDLRPFIRWMTAKLRQLPGRIVHKIVNHVGRKRLSIIR